MSGSRRQSEQYVRTAEDLVTIWAIALLNQEYGVPLDALELEFYTDFAEGTYQGGRRYQGRADVIIYNDRYISAGGGLDVAFIMLEALALSVALSISAYDACYAALAQRYSVPLLTQDQRLVNAL